MTPRTLVAHLAQHVQTRPATLAVASGTSGFTYAELWEGVLRAAAALRAEGIQPGDRVLLAATRGPEFLHAYFACHLLRAVAVPYEPDIVPARLQNIVEFLTARIVLTGQRALPQSCRSVALAALTDTVLLPHAEAFVDPDPDDTADILLTSGTTGKAKGVILTHRNILAAARNINQFIGNTAEDREVLALPLNHSFGLARLRCQILVGGTVILTPGFLFPKYIFQAMRSWRATGFSFVPAAWTLLTRLTGEKVAEFAPQLRYIEIGSAAMPRSEKEHLMRLFPHTRICMHYGLTEASRSAFIEFHESKDRLDSIGQPTPNVEIHIVDDEGQDVAPRQIGKIRISGSHITAGYWGADASERSSGTTLFSGDLGYRDEDGYLYLSGREDDVINVGGRKVHPTEIEHRLLGHQQIADAVCVGTPDPLTGEAIRAFVVAKRGQTERPTAEALGEFLRTRLEQYKIPLAFEWVAEIPRNASGKVERKTIARVLGSPAAPQKAGALS